MTELLSHAGIASAVAELPGVHRDGAGRLQVRVRAASFPDAVRLVADVAAVAEELDHHPDVDLRYRVVGFGLSTHSAGGVTDRDLVLARRILALAASSGAEVLAPRPRVEIALDAADPDAVRAFWRAGLGYREREVGDGSVELVDPDGLRPTLWFQPMSPARTERGRFHLDVYVPADVAEQRVADTLAAGGTLVTDEHAPAWWVLADAEGNELCICTPS